MSASDRTPLQSKKFIAFLVAEATWKILLAILVIMGIRASQVDLVLGGIVLAVVVVAGFVEAGYILGQASLDKYIQVADIATKGGKNITMKGMQVTQPSDSGPPNNG